MTPRHTRRSSDGVEQHREWLDLVDVNGPFLSLPVLRAAWPTLDALDRPSRDRLRLKHGTWIDEPAAGQQAWLEYVLRDLLDWRDAITFRDETDDFSALAYSNTEHGVPVRPDFALVEPGEDVKPATTRLVGLVCPPGVPPTAPATGKRRVDEWPASPVDRLAQLCRHHGIPLGLATDGRYFVLVWAPKATEKHPAVTTTAVFDAVSWPEAAERTVVRAFMSLLCRERFFAVPDDETLPALLVDSLDSQEELTEALGVQVRQAVELLVAAIGREDVKASERGDPSLEGVDAHEIYRGAVTVMMRIVFLLFADDRRLLPSDNALYAKAYSVSTLYGELHERSLHGTEDDLEWSSGAWHRLLALFDAVYDGIEHPRLRMHAHDGSIFDPQAYPWLPRTIDDRTVMHMLRAVQHVTIGRGRSAERRKVSFGTLDVEQIGYVYEGLLSFDAYRADEVWLGLIGKVGLEAEVRLSEMERLHADADDVDALAAALSEEHKATGIGSPKALAKRLAPLDEVETEEARKKLLAVTGGDYPLAEQLLPYFGILRRDLRDLPMVVLPGALYVTESALRKVTGTHYTPKELAEEVVLHALQPLVYEPGPLQTADESAWELKPSEDILSLKVADIAMGSAAFLVAAARYLGDQLVRAWSREGDERAQSYVVAAGDMRTDAAVDPVVVEARREVIEHCLYGVDINPMAVEMAKLSLWLVSMDSERPFTFLDDRLACGDSLLGITSLEQLEYMHLDPKKGREIHERGLVDFTAGVRSLVADVATDRRRIAEIELGDDPMAALARKRELLAATDHKTAQARLFADLVVGAALSTAGKGERDRRQRVIDSAYLAGQVFNGNDEEAQEKRRQWLATDHVDGSFDRAPLHWPVAFPEVFEQGGFDAIVGNPPFLGGQKLTGAFGTAFREYLVESIGRGARGSADLIAYFFLRAHELLNPSGTTGVLATNTLAQGHSREVGLDQVLADGASIRRSVKSKPWPSQGVALEYCAIWTSRRSPGEQAERIADGVPVPAISSALGPVSRIDGDPLRLAANAGVSFQGSIVLGLGFIVAGSHAAALIEANARNGDVLYPYLNGQDVNSRSDCSASRWIVNFHDWPEQRARSYIEVFQIIETKVKPGRQRRKPSGEYVLRRPLPEKYWQYAEKRPAMTAARSDLERVIVMAQVSRTVIPVFVPNVSVLDQQLVVFACEDAALLAALSCNPHYFWATTFGTTRRTDAVYTPSKVFETYPLPTLTQAMRDLGDQLDRYRREFMLARQLGLTKTYNLLHDSDCKDVEVEELRRIHRDIDAATVKAYGWDDLLDQLDHGFHPVARETRYTIAPVVKQEILDRLLELNHERYAEEVAAGLHDTKARKGKKASQGELF